jgi:hypothetical protein
MGIVWQEAVLVRLRKVGVVSFSLFFASFNALISFFISLILVFLLMMGVENTMNISALDISYMPFLLVLIIPLIIWGLSFILGVIIGWMINLLLKSFRGIHLYLEESQLVK